MKVTDYFRRSVLEDPDRSEVTVEMCERVVAEAEYTQEQDNGLWRIWGYVPELDRYVRVVTSANREWLINAFKDRNFTRKKNGKAGERVRIFYSPETDSLSIKLRDGGEEVVGEIMGEDFNDNVVLHRDDVGKLYEIEVIGSASKIFDLERVEIEGLPVSVEVPEPKRAASR